jgi:hypothetical protein
MNSSASSTHLHVAAKPTLLSRLLSVSPRTTFAVDAIITGPFTVALALLPAGLRELLGFSDALLKVAVIILVPFVAALALHCLTGARHRGISYALVVGNIAWVLLSIAVILGPWFSFPPWGIAFVVGQALLVDVLATWQFLALRRQR